jgi:O-antigen/teichoic acid export membrane protein
MRKYLLDRFFSLSGTALGIALTRAFSILLFVVSARVFAPDENGRFIQAVAIPQIVGQIAALGWLPLIVKEVSGRPGEPTARFRGFLVLATWIPLSCITLCALAALIYGIFSGNTLFYAVVGAFAVAYAGAIVLKEYMLALRYPAIGTLICEGLPFAFATAMIWLVRPSTVEGAICFLVIGAGVSVLIIFPIVWRHMSKYLRAPETDYDIRHWMRSSLFSFLGSGGRSLLDRLDVIVLSVFALTAQLALYNSSLRVANLLILPAIVLLPVFSPHLSTAAQDNNTAALRRDMLLQTLIVSVSSLPFAGVLIAFPDTIVGFVFGDQYRNVGNIMTFMIMAQVIFAFSLPWSNLALMRGRVRLYGLTNLLAFAVGMTAASLLLPRIGVVGVAIGSLVANALAALVFFGAEFSRLAGRQAG